MGAVNSTGNKLDRALAADLPEEERYFGLENFGNTCYCNSVLQALYFCEPFRRAVLDYERARRAARAPPDRPERASFLAAPAAAAGAGAAAANGVLKKVIGAGTGTTAAGAAAAGAAAGSAAAAGNGAGNGVGADAPATAGEETMLTALADLFHFISTHKKRTGSVPPKSFVNKLRQQNELFSTYMHQDAHEFLNFILNDIVECLRKESALVAQQQRRRRADSDPAAEGKEALANGHVNGAGSSAADAEKRGDAKTFVHDLFEGQLSNEVRCLCCETVTQRVESFFDLSVDVEQNSSLTACLRNFSSTELLRERDKFYCDMCCSLQEAERRMRVKMLPKILSLHLKRFKFIEQFKKYKKLSYRVVFPLELRLCNTSDDAEDPDRLYSLFAVVVHVGSGPNQGHYVSLIKSHGQWLMFDDDCVEVKAESELQSVFGITQDSSQSTEAGYILFYEQISSNT